jgi:hypothetical protein
MEMRLLTINAVDLTRAGLTVLIAKQILGHIRRKGLTGRIFMTSALLRRM